MKLSADNVLLYVFVVLWEFLEVTVAKFDLIEGDQFGILGPWVLHVFILDEFAELL